MNLSKEKGTMSTASSGSVVPDQFPVGLRVLVVDDDPTCLRILEKMLRTCLYDVTKCNRAEHALSLLRGNKNGFDVVISDVHMPDMDGFKLLEFIGLEMDLPVIMMSADDSKSVVMKGVTHGACDYLIKPVRIEALKNIWQHVVRKKKNEWKELEQSGSVEEGDRQPKPSEDADYSSSANEGNWRNSKRMKDDEDDTEEREDTSTLKKQRVVWSVELHQQFVAAVNQLGIDKAVPKKILELMNVPGLTRENVASHLQKYRLYLRRLSGVTQHQSNTFITPQEATYGTLTSLNGFDLQTLAATGQFPGQSLATLQAAGLGRSTVKSGIAAMPIVDQRNLFSFDNPKLSRYGDGQPQQKMNLLHGIPTSVEPKQLVNLHHSTQLVNNPHGGPSSQSSSILMHMGQSQSRGPIGQQPVLSNGISRNGVVSENGRTMGYNTITQNSPMLNFPLNQSSELPGNSFPLASAPGISTLVSKGPFNADIVNAEIKGSAGFAPSYDIFNDLQQHKPQNNWELQSVGLNFEGASQSSSNSIQGSINVTPSVLINQSYSTSQRNGQNSNSSMMGKTMFSVGGENEHLNNLIADNNSIQVKTERASSDASCQPGLFPQHFGQDDLMSALLKQQDSIGPAEHDFEFDGYSLDNISV